MKYGNYRDGFFLPNEIFQLGLNAGDLSVYSFLRRCENHRTHQCWPSIRTIGEAVGMSENTVRKYIRRLENRGMVTPSPPRSSPGPAASATAICCSPSGRSRR